MIVCLCRQVRESDIAEAINHGAASFDDVQLQTGASTCCGQCSDVAKEVSQSLIASKQLFSPA